MIISVCEVFDLDEYSKKTAEVFPNSIFIAPEWIECFKTSGRIPIYLRFISQEKTVGIIAGLRLMSSNRLVSKLYKPLFFFSGPSVIRNDKPLLNKCIKALSEFAHHHGYSRFIFYSWDYPQRFDVTNSPFITHTRKEFIIDLRQEWMDIIKRVRPYMKRNAKRAINNGATFHESHSANLVTELLFLLEETKKVRVAKGHSSYTYYYMPFLEDKIISEMVRRRIAKIFYVSKNNVVLSAELVLTNAKRAYALLNATSPEGYKIGANPFLKLNLIEKIKGDGFEYLNLGGIPESASDSGLAFYKLSCGAQGQVCMGGATKFLRGFITNFNWMLNAYEKIDREKVKRVLGNRIVEKVKFAKTNLHW